MGATEAGDRMHHLERWLAVQWRCSRGGERLGYVHDDCWRGWKGQPHDVQSKWYGKRYVPWPLPIKNMPERTNNGLRLMFLFIIIFIRAQYDTTDFFFLKAFPSLTIFILNYILFLSWAHCEYPHLCPQGWTRQCSNYFIWCLKTLIQLTCD